MQGKKIINYILATFIIGTFVLVYMQYNSAKSIDSLITGNEKMIEEFKTEKKLKELEKDVIYVESKVRGIVTTNDKIQGAGIEKQIAAIKINMNQLQQISDDDSSAKYIDELDTLVNQKLKFQSAIITAFTDYGKIAAEKLIKENAEKHLTDSIILIISRIDSTRKTHLAEATANIDKGGRKAKKFSTILIALVLLIAASLFWYIINIIRRQFQLINELNISEKKEKEASQIKENFMANMSHEIRTPMNAIIGFTNLLQRKNLDEESSEYVQTIHKSGENLLTIINDILDLSKIEAGMLRIEKTAFSIRELIHSLAIMFKVRAGEKTIKINIFIDDLLPDKLEGDATRLTQILVNLIGNALKFTEKGSIHISVSKESEKNGIINTAFTITDTGIGIEKEKLNSIFDRFKQAEDSVTRKYGGTGLGLAIVKDLILIQNGTLKIESEPGKGTRFYFSIPYTIAAENDGNASVEIFNEPLADHLNDAYILVAEDNEINQTLIKHLFKNWILLYDITSNGKEAFEALRLQPHKYSLILMDIQMPEMDGYTATQQIRDELKLDIPIIAMTAHALSGEREKCLSKGMNEYISKPIREQELHKLINHFLKPEKRTLKTEEAFLKPHQNLYNYINLDYMQEISAGNAAYEKTVTGLFIEAIPEDLKAIEKAYQNKDMIRLQQIAHNMKTTVAVMGLSNALETYLDALEYQQADKENMENAISSINLICSASLAEAQHFYSTFPKL